LITDRQLQGAGQIFKSVTTGLKLR